MLKYEYPQLEGLQAPYIVLANHTTNYDPILLALSFPQHMYFVASEHIYRWGLAGKLIQWAFAPIARLKGSTDATTVKKIIRSLREGTNVAIFAEGNRTYTGVTGPILSSTGKLVKASGAGLVTFRMEGGFFTSPRWGKTIRKGRMRGQLVQVYTPEELQQLSAEEVQGILEHDLHEDAYARQEKDPIAYRGKLLAEGLEIALYICPRCKEIGTLSSEGSTLRCTCGLHATYTDYCMLEGDELPFHTITDWDTWQRQELAARISSAEPPVLQDENQQLFVVDAAKGGTLAAEGTFFMDREGIRCGPIAIPMAELSNMAIIARMTLIFSTTNGEHYELRSARPRSAAKYMTYYQTFRELR